MSEPTPATGPADEPQPPVRWTVPTQVAEVPGAPGLAFADISSRLVAFLVDLFIVGVVAAALLIALGLGERVDTATSTSVWISGSTANVAFALLGSAYFVFFWSGGRRATIGQRAFDIQVGNAFDGRPLTLGQAARRWLGYGALLGLLGIVPALRGWDVLAELVWVVVLLATAVRSPTNQGLHDRFARSALVRPANRGTGGPAMACLIILILVGLLLLAAAAALIYLGSQIGPVPAPAGTPI